MNTKPKSLSAIHLAAVKRIQAENATLKAKTESLEAEVKKREQQIADFARRTGDEMECLQAKLRALEATPREANQGMLEVVDFLEFVANTFEGKSLGNRARNVLAVLSRPNGEAGGRSQGWGEGKGVK